MYNESRLSTTLWTLVHGNIIQEYTYKLLIKELAKEQLRNGYYITPDTKREKVRLTFMQRLKVFLTLLFSCDSRDK